MRAFLQRLRCDEGGTAAIEFALWSALFFAVVLVALDFGMYRLYQLRLASAVEEGAILSFNMRGTLSQDSGATVRNYVRASAGLPGTAPIVTMNCNVGTANCVSVGRTCACVSATGFTAAPCATACPAGGTAGYYLKLTASYTYTPVIVPNRWLSNRAMRESAVVRLQ